MGTARSAGSGYVGQVKLGQPKQIYLSAQTVMRMTSARRGEGFLRPPLPARQDLRGLPRIVLDGPPAGAMTVSTDMDDEILAGAMVQEMTMNPQLLPQVFAVSPLVRLESPDGMGYIDSHLQGRLSSSVLPNRPVHYKACSLPGPLNQAQQDYLNVFQGNNSGEYPPNRSVDPLPEVRPWPFNGARTCPPPRRPSRPIATRRTWPLPSVSPRTCGRSMPTRWT